VFTCELENASFTFGIINKCLINKNQNKMNKAELIEAIAASSKLSKADSKRALDAFIEVTTKALKKDDRVALVGFGSFSTSKRAARKGRNPQTGKEITIKAKKVVKFKAGAELSSKVK
jgi:DNA-binding protein HU-beta